MRHEDDFERRLAESLHHEAERIAPRDRREAILTLVEAGADPDAGRPRWLTPVAAAAGVAIIAAVAWGVTTDRGASSTSPASPPSSAGTATATRAPTTPAPTGEPSGQSTLAPPTRLMALPAYFVGPNGSGDRWGLYREFVSTPVAVGATDAQKARLAVAAAINVKPLLGLEPYLEPWAGTKVTGVTVTAHRITITLSNNGASGLTPGQTRLAVQQLVWTAQGAVGKGTIPVSFRIADGSTRLFGTYPTSTTYNRPPTSELFKDLATIWIDAPVRGQALPASKPVVVKGVACTGEANVTWELSSGSKRVRAGSTTASGACPARGTWQVDLGLLPKGSYTFRAYEPSAQDGQTLLADTSKAFSVG